MKKLSYIFVLLFSLNALSQTTISKNLGDFNTIKVYNGIVVELIKSTEQKIEITGQKSEIVKIKNVNDTLKLSLPFSLKPENNAANGEVTIKLFYKNDLVLIDANEGAIITGKNINQNKLIVNTQERAFIDLTVTVKLLSVRTSSGGIIKLKGTSDSQKVNVDLYGVYNGYEMKVSGNSNVKAGTGAKAEILAGESLNAKVGFGGSIFYKGNPIVTKDKKVVGGIIQKRN